MSPFKYVGKGNITPSADYFFIEATYNRIYGDSLFFLNKAKQRKIKEEDKDRYARVSIILMAFYLESVSNRLWDAFPARNEKKRDKENLPEPIKKLRAVYRKLCQSELPLSTDGINDIFTIRNKVFGHPPGSSVVAGTEVPPGQGRPRKHRGAKKINYSKFTKFPYVYSLFKTAHAETIFDEVTNFVNDYLRLLKDKVPDKKILNVIRPPKLGH